MSRKELQVNSALGRSFRVEADQRKDSIRRKLFPALQKGQLDYKSTFHNRSAELGNQFGRGCRRAARSDQIIGDHHTSMIGQSIPMNLEGIGTVLERIALAHALIRQLAWFAHGNEAGPQAIGDRREDLHRDWVDFFETNYREDGEIVHPREYLLVSGLRR